MEKFGSCWKNNQFCCFKPFSEFFCRKIRECQWLPDLFIGSNEWSIICTFVKQGCLFKQLSIFYNFSKKLNFFSLIFLCDAVFKVRKEKFFDDLSFLSWSNAGNFVHVIQNKLIPLIFILSFCLPFRCRLCVCLSVCLFVLCLSVCLFVLCLSVCFILFWNEDGAWNF